MNYKRLWNELKKRMFEESKEDNYISPTKVLIKMSELEICENEQCSNEVKEIDTKFMEMLFGKEN